AAYRRSLGALTANALTGRVASIASQLERVRHLERRRTQLLATHPEPHLAVVVALLEDCVTLGTIPFSIVARHAFIATSFIRSLIHCGVLAPEDARGITTSIRTVASVFVDDLDACAAGQLTKDVFLERYGHLRPGTYDICSPRYDQREDIFHGVLQRAGRHAVSQTPTLTTTQHVQIAELLSTHDLDITVEAFFAYIRDAITAREYAKFVFTKNLSDALEILGGWGENVGLSREELSFIEIHEILDTLNTATGRTLEQHLRERSRAGRMAHELTQAMQLPYLIERPEDVAIVPLLLHKPNFITTLTVRAPLVFLDGKHLHAPELTGRIVAIESADPGFDWVFTRDIRGLVTKYGGANSHMAIRCAEFGLPAAIGCGEQIFDRICHARAIELNCSEGRVDPVAL
ncbi:MAG: PEP-utilizing enzyme, partial [bacterium]|nr:PEP-utilizing enzyme [bacterium]